MVTAVLASQRFLFRLEDAVAATAAGPVPIDEYALALRLSYFLWSTMPDDELFRLAREGTLRNVLPQQVARMVADHRRNAFVENFVGQWLQTRDVEALPFDVRRVLDVKDHKTSKQSTSSPRTSAGSCGWSSCRMIPIAVGS